MRKGIVVTVNAADRSRLEAVEADRNSAQKHAWRAQVVLLTADLVGTAAIMRQTGLGKPSVWRWQERYIEAGSTACCATRPGRRASRRWTTPRWPTGPTHAGAASRRAMPATGRSARWRWPAACRRPRCTASGRKPGWRRIAAVVQAVERSGVRRQARGGRGALCRPAPACGHSVDR